MQVGIIDKNAQIGKACPADFKRAAKIACRTKFEDAPYVFPNTREFDLPYICMDLVYQYSLLVDGFGKFTYIFILSFKSNLDCVIFKTWLTLVFSNRFAPLSRYYRC